jgi:hypothetical protein
VQLDDALRQGVERRGRHLDVVAVELQYAFYGDYDSLLVVDHQNSTRGGRHGSSRVRDQLAHQFSDSLSDGLIGQSAQTLQRRCQLSTEKPFSQERADGAARQITAYIYLHARGIPFWA